MTPLSFVGFTLISRKHKGRLIISQRPGVPPPKLPHWLQIPYLVPTTAIWEPITLETINPIIQRGYELIEQGRAEIVGTLGVIMKSKSAHFGITAGHVICNDTYVLDVHRSDGEVIIPLQVANFSSRMPLNGELTSFTQDCGFLEIPPAYLQQSEIEISNINPHYYNETKPLNIEDPLSSSRRESFERIRNVGKVIVYKVGASTDLTVGYFIAIKDRPPPGMYGRDLDSHEESLWWDSVLNSCSDSEDSGESGSCHSGGLWQSNISRESSHDSNGSDIEKLCTKEEDTSDRSSYNSKADSSLKQDGESQDCSDASDFEASIHPEDREEWYQKESGESDDSESIEDKDPNEWFGVVQWISADYDFAAGGDSGSLVFATEGNTVISIGIRVGRPRSGFSIFISLETYCYKAELHGHILGFAKK